MATVEELILRFRSEGANNLVNDINRIRNSSRDLNTNMRDTRRSGDVLTNTFRSMGKAIGALVIADVITKGIDKLTDAFMGAVSSGWEFNIMMDSMTMSYETLLGTAEAGTKMTKDIIMMAAETPFKTRDLSQATRTLLGYGVVQENVLSDVKMMGDVVAALGGDGGSLMKMSLAYGQMTAKGKLQAEEVRQMVNQGFNPLMIISEKTGKTIGELTDLMREGGITTDMVRDAFVSATSETGRFSDAMEKMSKTYAGQKQRLEEYVDILFGKLTRPFFDYMAEVGLPRLTSFVIKITEGFDSIAPKLKTVFENLKKIVEIVGRAGEAAFFTIVIPLAQTLASDLEYIYLTLINIDLLKIGRDIMDSEFGDEIQSIGNWLERLQEIGGAIVLFLGSLFKPMIESIIKTVKEWDWTPVTDSAQNLFKTLKDLWPVIELVIGAMSILFGAAMTNIMASFNGILGALPYIISGVLDAISLLGDAINWLVALFSGDTEKMGEISDRMLETFISLFTNIGLAIYNFWTKSKEVWDTFLNKVFIQLTGSTMEEMRKKAVDKLRELGRAFVNFLNPLITWFRNKFSQAKSNFNTFLKAVKYVFNHMKTYVLRRINEIKRGWKATWNAIKLVFEVTKQDIKRKIDFMLKSFRILRDEGKKIFSKLSKTIKDIINKLPPKMYRAGKNIVQELIDGFNNKIGALKRKVSAAADTIKNFLGFSSPTKEGAGKDADKWMPNFVDMLVDGLKKGSRHVSAAAGELSKSLQVGAFNVTPGMQMNSNIPSVGAGFGNNIVININGTHMDIDDIGRKIVHTLEDYGIKSNNR